MSKRKELPRHSLLVETYEEFRDLIRAYANGKYDLTYVLGNPGIGKSETVIETMQEVRGAGRWGLIQGKHAPLDLYQRLHQFRSVPVVFDDLDDLIRKSDNIVMLKSVCDTRPVKRVEWGSRHAAFKGKNGLPKSFESISRVCVIANDLASLNRNVAALLDRGVVILFQPSALEIHEEIARGGWFDDEEAFSFIGQNLYLVTEPSFRFYKMARDHKRAGLNWRDLILRAIESAADPKLILVARLLADPKFDGEPAPEAARIQAFFENDGGSKATYHRHKADLLARRGDFRAEEVASIKLQPYRPSLRYLAMLDRRDQLEQMGNRMDNDDPEAGVDGADGPPEADQDLLTTFRRELERAIAKEDYESAAKLRDKILQLEAHRDGENGATSVK